MLTLKNAKSEIQMNFYEKLNSELLICANESEVAQAFSKACDLFGIRLRSEVDRNDASYRNVILEYKDKGFFNGSRNSQKFKEAVDDRLKKYIKRKATREGENQDFYIGIATDGTHVSFCSMKDDVISAGPLVLLNESSAMRILNVLNGAGQRTLTTMHLIEDFGHNSLVGPKLMSALSNELEIHFNSHDNNKIKMLFSEWQSLFGQVAGLTGEQIKQIKSTLKFPIPQLDGQKDVAGLLFIIHTYNALIMKLLGAEILSNLGLTDYTDFCAELVTREDSLILRAMAEEIESGHFFESVGINGFVEEALFSWYLDISEASDKIQVIGALKSTLSQFSMYRMGNLTSARSRDVLKGFYQALVPDVLRKSLGEFYTPDWLVEHTIEASQTKDWLNNRVLDPTCGSGSFLLSIIRRKRAAAKNKNLSPAETVKLIVDSVWGFDLNPLAVQTARVNYLIAISDLLLESGSLKVELPILLADSVYSPAREMIKGHEIIEYKIGSQVANLSVSFPRTLVVQREKLEAVFKTMGECVDDGKSYLVVEKILCKRGVLSLSEVNQWGACLENTYNQVLTLHEQNWNGIWFRIIRNFFWTINAKEFELIVGNPPWVRWSALPGEYRDKVKETCEAYEIFSDTKFHGGNELDISGMITYTVADTWLKPEGTIAFVLPQNHFQSASSQGFRSFKINNSEALIPYHVDDLKELKPFKAANKTAVVCFKKTIANLQTVYPVKYMVWSNKQGFSKTISENLTLQEVKEGITIVEHEANPVSDIRSPWAVLLPGHFKLSKAIQGLSSWVKGRKGVTADLNGIYMVEILEIDTVENKVRISTRPEAGKKNLGEPRKFWIEPDALYPLVKGASDFGVCDFHPQKQLYFVVPNNGITKQVLLDSEDIIENKLPATYDYFKKYKSLLEDRSTYKQRLAKYAFYHVYNVGAYTFSPYKVIWAEQSGVFKSTVVTSTNVPLIGSRPYVPDHKVYFVDMYNKVEAYYLCGLLCTSIVTKYIESHTVKIQVSNIFKHLNLPPFDGSNKIMKELSKKTEKAHYISAGPEKESILKEIDDLGIKIINSL